MMNEDLPSLAHQGPINGGSDPKLINRSLVNWDSGYQSLIMINFSFDKWRPHYVPGLIAPDQSDPDQLFQL